LAWSKPSPGDWLGIGLAASQYVMRWDHWIAFALLMLLGVRMEV
jgi:putative Mn2+ efflux pump MntP